MSISELRELRLVPREGIVERTEGTSDEFGESDAESVRRPLLEPSVVRGSRNEKRLPLPSAESTRNCPPSCSTMRATTANPSPDKIAISEVQ